MTSRHMELKEPTRRNFLFVTTGAVAAVGMPFAAWPLIDQMNPDASVSGRGPLQFDIRSLEPGTNAIVRGEYVPLLIRHRTQAEIETARAVAIDSLRDQLSRTLGKPGQDASDVNRTYYPDGKILVIIPVCTRRGCIVVSDAGDFDGWFCPCCGSHFDTSGRVRKGPAPHNLWIPEHRFWDRLRIAIDRYAKVAFGY